MGLRGRDDLGHPLVQLVELIAAAEQDRPAYDIEHLVGIGVAGSTAPVCPGISSEVPKVIFSVWKYCRQTSRPSIKMLASSAFTTLVSMAVLLS